MPTTPDDDTRAKATAMLASAISRMSGYDHEMALAAVAMGADLDAPLPDGAWPIGGERPSPLHAALRQGNLALATLLMSAGASIDGFDSNGKPTVFWLQTDSCARAWIAAGGDPWQMFESRAACYGKCPPERKNFAWIACRGGDAELWELLASAFHPNVDIAELGCSNDYMSGKGGESVMDSAIAWTNIPAIETLFKLGYQREERHVAKIAKHWACAQQQYQRFAAQRMAKVFFSFGARPASDESYREFQWLVGPESVEKTKAWMEAAFLDAEKKSISKAAKGRGARKPAGGRGRL